MENVNRPELYWKVFKNTILDNSFYSFILKGILSIKNSKCYLGGIPNKKHIL